MAVEIQATDSKIVSKNYEFFEFTWKRGKHYVSYKEK